MAQIKGLAVRARLEYLEQQFGRQGLSRVVDALTPEHRELLRDGVLVSGWYPLSLSDDLLGCAERLLGRGDGGLCREIGRASARKGLAGVHSAFAGKLDPDEIAAKMARSTALLWQSYYDRGTMTTRALDTGGIESELTGMDVTEPWLCHVLTGYIGAHVEVLGGSNVTVVHAQCHSRGEPRCVWSTRWRL